MAKTRHWQARVTYPGDRVLVFGIQARSLPAALLTAHQRASWAPQVADSVRVTRLYGRYHPLRMIARSGSAGRS